MHIRELETPALVLDIDSFAQNRRQMSEYLEGSSARLRPHFKSHKCTAIAKQQMEDGAKGITCAKLSEAEIIADAGIEDVLIANEIVQPSKLSRAAYLAKKCRLTLCVDSIELVARLEEAARAADSIIYIYVELDVGMKRCGVSNFEQFLEIVRCIQAAKHLQYAGVQAYAGHLSHTADQGRRTEEIRKTETTLKELGRYLQQHGVAIGEISGGSTCTAQEKAAGGVYTELQAGSYIFLDTSYGPCGLAFQNALTVLSTVISRTGGSIVTDVGVKNLSMDQEAPRADIQLPGDSVAFHEEHTIIYRNGITADIGSQVAWIPGHCCTTVNTFDAIYLKKERQIIGKWKIEGRGKSL